MRHGLDAPTLAAVVPWCAHQEGPAFARLRPQRCTRAGGVSGTCLAFEAMWMRGHRNAALRRRYEAHVGPAARRWHLGKPMAPHYRSCTGPMKKGAWRMKSLSSLLLVSLSIAVTAPAAARPRTPVAAWPGVSDVLLSVAVAAPAAAPVAAWPNDSEQPGSVLVFPKFIRGTFADPFVTGQTAQARTELEISVVCPKDATCEANQAVRLRAHWVCPGSSTNPICPEASFDLETTVGGTLYFNPEGVVVVAGVITANAFPSNATTTIPQPPCDRGYLIVWAIDGNDTAIKFDGLIGDAVIRDAPAVVFFLNTFSARSYNAIPIQAGDGVVNTGDPTDLNGDGALDFDRSEYQAVAGRIFGTVRYENAVAPEGNVETDLTLLTLDVASNRPNPVTSVGLNFFTTGEDLNDAGTSFYCWKEQRLTDILASLTTQNMGRKGLVESTYAEQVDGSGTTVPVTLLGIIETKELDRKSTRLNSSHGYISYAVF